MGAVDVIARELALLYARPQIAPDHRCYVGPDRFYLRTIHAFNDCFAVFSDGYRQNWWVRNSQKPAPAPTQPWISPPIGYGGGAYWLSYSYVSSDAARAKIAGYKRYGYNGIRLWVGIGMVYTIPRTDPVTGLSFPSEMDVLRDIVNSAAQLGMYVTMVFGQGSVPGRPADLPTGVVGTAQEFWAIIAGAFKDCWNVIFELQNETGSGLIYNDVNSPSTQVAWSSVMTDATAWATRIGALLTTVRAAGAKNLCMVSPYANLWHVSTIITQLDDPGLPFNADINLGIAVHPDYIFGNTPTTFDSYRPSFNSFTTNYGDYYPLFASEVAFTNQSTPYTDGGVAANAFMQENLTYIQGEKYNGAGNFVTYPNPKPGNGNDIFDPTTGAITSPWGNTAIGNFATGGVQPMTMTPKIYSVMGALTDTSASTILWRRRKDMSVVVKPNIVITTNGTATGPLFFRLPVAAPTNRYQYGYLRKASGTQVLVTICGPMATITELDGTTYPGADGASFSGTFEYDAVPPGIASYDPFTFNGSSTYFTRGGPLTNVSNGQQGVVFFQAAMQGGDGVVQRIIQTATGGLALVRNTSNKIELTLRNTSGATILDVTSVAQVNVASGLSFGVITWDLGASPSPIVSMNVNGSSYSGTPTIVADTARYSEDWGIGATVTGADFLNAKVYSLLFAPIYFDFTSNPPHGNLLDYKNNVVEMGPYGFDALNLIPALYFRITNSDMSTFNSRGYGGGFTKHP